MRTAHGALSKKRDALRLMIYASRSYTSTSNGRTIRRRVTGPGSPRSTYSICPSHLPTPPLLNGRTDFAPALGVVRMISFMRITNRLVAVPFNGHQRPLRASEDARALVRLRSLPSKRPRNQGRRSFHRQWKTQP